MKTLIYLLRQSLKAHITLICFFCMPYIAFAIEPIATIGQPRPLQHAFLNNGTILRVVPSHIQVVDANTGEVIDRFGNKDYFSKVVFSPDGTHLAIFNSFGYPQKTKVQIWNINALERIATWEIEGGIDVVAFSPTQPLLAISVDDEIHLWNWQTGEFIGTMIGDRRPADTCYYVNGRWRTCWSPIHDFASVFSPDGRYLIVASMRPDIELWNVETRQLEGHLEGHIGNWVDGVVISPDGKYIASFDRIAGFVYVWHMKAQHLLWKAKSAIGSVTMVTFSPDSQRLYVASRTGSISMTGTNPWVGWDERVRVWDVNSGQQIDMFETEFKGLQTITISPDGKKALLLYTDGEIMWDIENKRIHRMWTDFIATWWPYTDNKGVALSPDGKTVIAISSHFIKSWDVASQQMRLLVSAEDYRFNAVTISPDSQKFAVGKEPFVEIRDIQTGKIETQFPHYVQLPEKITFSSSGKWLAVKDHWGRTDIFNVEFPENKQRLILPFGVGASSSYQIGFSENERHFVTSGRTKIDDNNHKYWILLWKREENTFVFQYAWEGAFDSSPAFMTDTDGSTVLAGNGENGIHIWKLLPDTAQLLTTLDGEFPIQFSPDGRYLFAYRDENFQIWDWQRSRLINQPSLPWFLNMSQDGSLLLTHNSQREYQLWDLNNMLSFLPYPVEPKGKQFVTLGQIKKNQLLQNFPNPFNPETWIPFKLADKSDVTIRIYTPTGQLVRSLSPGTIPAGDYSSQSQAVHWDGRNDKGETVSSGVYLYTIDAGDFSATRKMLIQK